MAQKKQKTKLKQTLSSATTTSTPQIIATTTSEGYKFPLSPIVIYMLLAITITISFAAGFSNNFVEWDDQMYVSNNFMVRNPTFENLIRLLSIECALNYHPLTMVTLWINSALFGEGASSFIITNTVIHIINTFLVFHFSQQLTKKATLVSFLVALFWGIHPMHVESVIWVAERKDVLYTMFFFLACIQYVKYLEKNERKALAFCFMFFVLSCFSKAMAVVLPLILLLIDYWFDKGFLTRKNIITKIPFFIVSLLFGILAIHVQGGGNLGGRIEKTSFDNAITDILTLREKINFGFYGFLNYIFKFFIPINQHHFYSYPVLEKFGEYKYTTAPIGALLILAGGAFYFRRRKEIFFGIMFFFLTIVLVLQFMSVGAAIMAERYTYIPYFGLLFLIFYLLNQKIALKNILLYGSIPIALLFMYLIYKQTLTYKSTRTLFENSYKYEPESILVNENLVADFARSGKFDEVIRQVEQVSSRGIESYALIGEAANAYRTKGQIEKALSLYQKSIDTAPANKKYMVYHNRGITNQNAGNFSQASEDFTKAMELAPMKTNFLGLRAFANLKANKFKEAYDDYSVMIKEGIAIDTCYNARAVARHGLGDLKGAIEDLKESIKYNPNNKDANANLVRLGVVKK